MGLIRTMIWFFQLSQKNIPDYEANLCDRFRLIADTNSDDDFRVLQKYIDENFSQEFPITPQFIRNIINKIQSEKVFSFFQNQSQVILKQVKNTIGEIHIEQNINEIELAFPAACRGAM